MDAGSEYVTPYSRIARYPRRRPQLAVLPLGGVLDFHPDERTLIVVENAQDL